MSIQSSISPMAPAEPVKKEEKKKKLSPIEQEFEDGKKFLGNGDLAQAAITFHNVLLGHEEKNNENGVANAVNQLGLVCMAKEEYAQARVHFQRAYKICDKNFDEMSLMALDRQFLAIHRSLKEYDKAIDKCLDFIKIFQQNRDPNGTVLMLEEMAHIYEDADDLAKAADTYRTIASIHKNYKHAKLAEDFMKKAESLEK
ncbi:MAG: hypothetical protein OCC45_01115 [Desulfotalea sp.]